MINAPTRIPVGPTAQERIKELETAVAKLDIRVAELEGRAVPTHDCNADCDYVRHVTRGGHLTHLEFHATSSWLHHLERLAMRWSARHPSTRNPYDRMIDSHRDILHV